MKFFEEYLPEAIKTESIKNIDFNGVNSRLLHASLGLATECGELLENYYGFRTDKKEIDYKNLKEEIGDLAWYLAVLFDYFNIKSVDDIDVVNAVEWFEDLELLLLSLTIKSSELLDVVKKAIFYDRDFKKEDLIKKGYEILLTLDMLCDTALNSESLELSGVLELNISKLSKRYKKGKFDSEDANKRDVKKELEGF